MMSKLGGGTSGYFGKIRPRGAEVKNNGQASGSVHIMQLFESMVDVVKKRKFKPCLTLGEKWRLGIIGFLPDPFNSYIYI